MGTVHHKTKVTLHEFVYEGLDEDQLKRRLRCIERDVKGANPHNIGMATFRYASDCDDETEREIKQVLANTFADNKLPGKFPEE